MEVEYKDDKTNILNPIKKIGLVALGSLFMTRSGLCQLDNVGGALILLSNSFSFDTWAWAGTD